MAGIHVESALGYRHNSFDWTFHGASRYKGSRERIRIRLAVNLPHPPAQYEMRTRRRERGAKEICVRVRRGREAAARDHML